jgi:hypothetical protein
MFVDWYDDSKFVSRGSFEVRLKASRDLPRARAASQLMCRM